ncbi:serine hydrolase domain-containing protein [Mesorhizobium xinjiangense]|uniref:serine hydrolase domain-containing protein n=1 Tax=Mesorhizobium xinjiangense TaxID=2678685 RepID=UPI0012EE1F0D|nr:serine hydrolase [Mesorhizobium xinjiangense]
MSIRIAASFLSFMLLVAGPLPVAAQQPSSEQPASSTAPSLAAIVDKAAALDQLETLIVARDGEILVEEGFGGHSTTTPTNIKSASKAIIAALVGIAIDKGLLEGPDQPIAPLLADKLPEDADPRLERVTIGNLLSMQAGLERTSGRNYGRWVASRDWVREALAQPFVDEPGGGMLYSTGNTHLLSAILTRQGRRSTLQLAREWLEPVEGFVIADWMRDPQGVYFGGNQMAMSPRSMLAFGELFRNGGRAGGQQVVPEAWIEQCWQPRTRSVFHDDQYGYGWFLTEMAGHDVNYAWGHGGQMIYVAPGLGLTVVMTSAADRPSARNGHRDRLHGLMQDIVRSVNAAESAAD